MVTVYDKFSNKVHEQWVSMFGMTNSKELMLRCQQAGIPVSDAFFEAHQRDNINACADELEDGYSGLGLRIKGENVVVKDQLILYGIDSFVGRGWFFLESGFDVKLQSTIQPASFVTLPWSDTTEALVNDLLASGLYRYWGTA